MAENIPQLEKLSPPKFNPEFQILHSGLKGGIVQVVDNGPSFWVAKYETSTDLTDEEYGIWNAWLDSLRGGVVAINAWVRKYPIKYELGNYPDGFNGVGSVDSFVGKEISVSLMPAGFELVPGDVFTIPGDVDRLYRVIVGDTANGAGQMNLEVQPDIHPSTQIDDEVKFTNPWFTAQIQPEVDRGSPMIGKRQIKFSVVQRLKI